MSGGKSKSTTETTQTSTQQDASGVVGGDIIQGSTVYDYFPSDVADAFKGLIDLSNKSIGAAVAAGGAALEKVAIREEQVSNPELATLTKILPAIMIGIVVLGAVMIWRKK